jgi:hypothetical protein
MDCINIVSGMLELRKRLRNSCEDSIVSCVQLSKKTCSAWDLLPPAQKAEYCSGPDDSSLLLGTSVVSAHLSHARREGIVGCCDVGDDSFPPSECVRSGARRRAVLSRGLLTSSNPLAKNEPLRRVAMRDRRDLIDFLLKQSIPLAAMAAPLHNTMTSKFDRMRVTRSMIEALLDAASELATPGPRSSDKVSVSADLGVTELMSSVPTKSSLLDGFASICHMLTAADVRCLLNYRHGCVRCVVAHGCVSWTAHIIQLSSVVVKKGRKVIPVNPRIAANSFSDPKWRRRTGIRWKYITIGTFATERLAIDAYHRVSSYVYALCLKILSQDGDVQKICTPTRSTAKTI